MQHLDVGVELLADAVPDERLDDPQLVRTRVIFDRPADVADRAAGADRLDALPGGLLGDSDEIAALLVDVADEERGVRVTVHAAT